MSEGIKVFPENKGLSIYELSDNLHIELGITRGPITAFDCYKDCPTILELHALSRVYQELTGRHEAETGEWTSDFIFYGNEKGQSTDYMEAELVRMPDNIVAIGGKWYPEGGIRIPVVLPDDGWAMLTGDGLLFDPITGLPYQTTLNPSLAHEKSSFFWRGPRGGGLRVINRECERMGPNAIDISTSQRLDFKHSNIGFRKVIRN